MGLLDAVAGVLGGGGAGAPAQGDGTSLVNAVLGMLANGSAQGGLAGLVQQFEQAGLGHVVSSWISSGQNLPISADQISQVLGGSGVLSHLSTQTGVPAGDLSGHLSQMLPGLIDQLTPHGQVPQGGLGDVGSLLGKLLGSR